MPLEISSNSLIQSQNPSCPPIVTWQQEYPAKSLPYKISNFQTYERMSPGYKNFLVNLIQIVIPKIVEEALRYPHWRNVMNDEMQALIKNETWEVVERPKDKSW